MALGFNSDRLCSIRSAGAYPTEVINHIAFAIQEKSEHGQRTDFALQRREFETDAEVCAEPPG